MKSKHWLAAVLIISLLAIAFFWGANHQDSTTRIDENYQTHIINDNTASPQNNEQLKKEECIQFVEDAEKAAAKTDKTFEKAGKKTEQEDLTLKVQDDTTARQGENKTEKTAHETENKKDKYLTDPVPDGKPQPIEWQAATINEEKILTCTLSVTCKTILDNMDKFNNDKLEVLPEDGIIFKTQTVTFCEGESVFDVLLREMQNNKIHMEFEMTPIYNSNYIEGIHNLYEFDCGELSGWMYKVNEWFPNYGCSRYSLKDRDTVEWIYTCDLGRDIGGGTAVGGKGQ